MWHFTVKLTGRSDVCQYSYIHNLHFSLHPGVRAFVPKPVATNLQYVGGAAAILGLVAMASDVEGLYAAVKALVCVVKSNPLASKEMERIKGYQVSYRRAVTCMITVTVGGMKQLCRM